MTEEEIFYYNPQCKVTVFIFTDYTTLQIQNYDGISGLQ